MRIRHLAAALGISFLAAIGLIEPAATQGLSLDDVIEPIRLKFGLPALGAAVVKNGSIITSGAVGVRAQGTDVAVTIDDRFHIGSDAKAMTATMAGMLIDEGRLRWNSSVGEVLAISDMNPKLAAATLEQLLSHSSGIPSDTKEMLELYFNTDAFDYNLSDLRLRAITAWRKNQPKVPEGSLFQYANFGYLIAGAMLEKAAGIPWERLIVTRLFEPLRLHSAGLGPQATTGKLDAPVGHKLDENGSASAMYWGAAADGPPMMGPAGTVHMSVLDFARWAGWNAGKGERGPALVRPQTLRRIHQPHVKTPRIEHPQPGTPQTGEYALGWGVVLFDWTARPVLMHNGSNSMNLSKILVDSELDLGIVVMTNFPGPKA